MAFDRERFVEDCIAANVADGQAAVSDLLERAIVDHASMLADLGEPKRAGLDVIHRSPQLTIFAAKWAPNMTLAPHNHRMWALIGIYAGREDNMFWKRAGEGLAVVGARAMFAGDIASMTDDAIHSVTNPLGRFAGGLHIYGGDFFDTPRSLWDAETLAESPSDGAVVQAIFERENARLGLD